MVICHNKKCRFHVEEDENSSNYCTLGEGVLNCNGVCESQEPIMPDKFYCECGTEVSSETMACAGMCNKCYIEFEKKHSEKEASTK